MAKSVEAVKMRRMDLYQAVWADPVFHVAKRLNISDRGLAEVCRRMDVPTPPRGYWRKVQTGQQPSVTPLPDPANNPLVVIEGSPVAQVDELANGESKPKSDQNSVKLEPVVQGQPIAKNRDIFQVNSAVHAERIKAEELAVALSRYRAVDQLLAELDVLRKFQQPAIAVVIGRWTEIIRDQQAANNPLSRLLSEFSDISKDSDYPLWWS